MDVAQQRVKLTRPEQIAAGLAGLTGIASAFVLIRRSRLSGMTSG